MFTIVADMSKGKKQQLTLGYFFKKTSKQPDQEDQPTVAGGSTLDVVNAATTEPTVVLCMWRSVCPGTVL